MTTENIIFKQRKDRTGRRSQRLLFALIFLLLYTMSCPVMAVQANTHNIRGHVTDQDGNALPGVSVSLENSTRGTTTDAKGNYTLTVSNTKGTLVFSFIGYTTRRVVIDGRTTLNVSLTQKVSALNQLVVVGYGTQKKSDLTGAIASITSKDFNKGVAPSLDGLIQGKAAGVRVVQNSNEPGGGISVDIRGASSINAGTGPLYVIDGLPLDNSVPIGATGQSFVATRTPRNPLASLNPADIASIEVLKDASATAIYGARGANGVVLITTKSGKTGSLSVSYDGYVGFQSPAHTLDVLTAKQYSSVLNDIIADGGGSASEKVTGIEDGGTDWQEAVFKTGARVQNHNLAFQGGNGKTSYRVSLNYFDQDGIVMNTSFKRYNARFNLRSHISDKFTVGVHFNSSYDINNYVPVGFGINENAGVLYAAFNFDPTLAIRDSAGSYQRSPYITIDNPVALAEGKRGVQNSYRTLGTIFGEYRIIPGLVAKLNLGGNVTNSRKDVYISRFTNDGAAAGGIATILTSVNSNYLAEATLNYSKTFGVHHINILGGATTQKFIDNNSNATGRNYVSDVTFTNAIGTGDPTLNDIGSDKSSHRLISFIGRVNYNLLDKYLLTATLRADGSSRFGENRKFGYFPSLAGAWKIDKEPFMKNQSVFSSLKIRASWGQTGNQSIGNYHSLITYTRGPDAVIGEQPATTQEPARLANPGLIWETTEQTDIGIDFGLWEGRLSGTMDYYRKHTFNMLVDLPIPTSTGFNTKLSNVGSIRNEGWELTLNSVNLDGAFKWSTSVNLATLKNRVLNIGGIPPIITGGAGVTPQIAIIEPGRTLRSYYGYQVTGVWQQGDDYSKTKDGVVPGDLKYKDVNGDSTVNAADRVILGNSFPKLTWGLSNTFGYKNFQLDIFIMGVQGVSMLNNNLVDTYFPVNFRRNKFAKPYLNRWTPENPSDKYPSFVTPLDQGQKLVNSYTVQDASYLRLQTVRLSYTFPYIRKIIRSATLYITGQNLLTLTKYQGMDPAVNTNGDAGFNIDYNAYPASITTMIGVNVNF
jgi:TonB-linked SusC/RagA family outer membrane protein